MATSKWFIILRDLLLLGLGVFGILHQELTGNANALLLAVYTTLLGIPGAANLYAIVRSTSSGASPPSAPQPPASQQESSHS